jgi:hypothetical protein
MYFVVNEKKISRIISLGNKLLHVKNNREKNERIGILKTMKKIIKAHLF